ncbi:M56 family metallopeptidase [Pedobacter nototheniae]|uniref:M56 family metallopeptidase n=1 Tax=Pedobacter nototheniae TaxID=2488994 RepID=UPI00103B67B3|nr:M56 family metallopeptidase [Pedobacter nototheniae]
MEWLLIYLFKVSVCTTLLFGFYLLVLRRLTFFKINRFYLIISLLLSFIIPAIQINIERAAEPSAISSQQNLIIQPQEIVQSMPLVQTIEDEPIAMINWLTLAETIYIIVVVVLFLISMLRLFQLFTQAKKYTHQVNGLKLIPKQGGFTNCSFLNYVFFNRDNLTDDELQILLKHEQVHANQYHSADKILMMICKAILWFNPIVYLYNEALEQVHEYEADHLSSLSFGNKEYAGLLLKLAIIKSDMPLVHNFVKSPVKERIKMLFQSKSKSMKKLTYLLVLPFGLGLMWLFSVQIVYAQILAPANVSVNKDLIRKSTSSEVTKNKQTISSSKFKAKEREFKTTPLNADTAKFGALVMPKLISYNKLIGDMKRKLNKFEDVEMEVYGGKLKAAFAEVDMENGIINAKDVVFVNRYGNEVSSKTMIFELKKGTYYANTELKQSSSMPSELRPESILEDKVEYSAKDSVKMSKDKSIIYLYGNAKMSYKDFDIMADQIIYNTKTLTGSAKDPVFVNRKNQAIISGKSLKFDLKGKTEIWQD